MTSLSGLQIFKYLPASKKEEYSNCKVCGCPTCMAFALKLAKKQVNSELCPHISQELKDILSYSNKEPQKTLRIKDLTIGGENVLFRHEKTFVNRTAIVIFVDTDKFDWQEKLKRIEQFEMLRLSETLGVDLIVFKGAKASLATTVTSKNSLTYDEFKQLPLIFIEDENFETTVKTLTEVRQKAVLDKDESCSDPVCVMLGAELSQNEICARVSYYICKYANIVCFENFDEALISTVLSLRQNIYTDPQKTLQVESKIYEFNNPDENSLIFMTTNFALTFYAVANELDSLRESSYLIVTPSEGMSVLTAWSAEKFTAKKVVKMLKEHDFASKMKNRDIIIPGLLAHMKDELEEEFKIANLDFNIVVGTVEAIAIQGFVNDYLKNKS